MALMHNERVRWLITAGVVILAVLILLRATTTARPADDATVLLKAPESTTIAGMASSAATPTGAPKVAVDLIGAVQQPGVYYLDATARVDDAVKAAGGLAPDAARDQINLAAALKDGEQIKVPRVGDVPATDPDPASSAQASDEPVNINGADAAALDQLPGIGPVTAQAIVDYRTSSGPFKRIDDLQNVKGIGPSLLAQLKGRITIGP